VTIDGADKLGAEAMRMLDCLEEQFGDGRPCRVENVMVVVEVEHTPEGCEEAADLSRRGFSHSQLHVHCSDSRPWIQQALVDWAQESVEQNRLAQRVAPDDDDGDDD
jgi:hypothetical protein